MNSAVVMLSLLIANIVCFKSWEVFTVVVSFVSQDDCSSSQMIISLQVIFCIYLVTPPVSELVESKSGVIDDA